MEQLQIHYVDLGVKRVSDLRGELSVGRTEGNDLVLNHPSVSRKHARIEQRNDKIWIIDLKSTTGAKANGTLVTEAQKPVPRIPTPAGLKIPEEVSREKIFQVLVQVAKAMLQSEDLNSLLEVVMDMIFRYLPVERGLLILFDQEGNPVPKLTRFIEGAEAQDIPISRTILKMVAQQQVSLMTSNALEDARLLGGKSIAIHGIRSAMCVPLWNRNRVIGAVQVDSPIHVGRFTEEDLDLLTALANFAAVAIERAQLTERIEVERKIRARMERYHSPAVVDEIVKGSIRASTVAREIN